MSRRRAMGIRRLRDDLSAVLRGVRCGEAVTVTDHRRPVALLLPIDSAAAADLLGALASVGRVGWSGGKPAGARRPPRVRGPSVAAAVVEDRR